MRYENFHQNRITQATFNKLRLIQITIMISIQTVKNSLYTLFWVIDTLTVSLALQIIDRVDDFQHFFLVNFPVVICVVEVEAQAKLLPRVSVS